MEPMTKDEYIAFASAEREKQQKAQAEVMANVVTQFTQVLREANAPEAEPSAEELAEKNAELLGRMRDGFAAAALSAMDIQNSVAPPAAGNMARSAYVIADAMLKERAIPWR